MNAYMLRVIPIPTITFTLICGKNGEMGTVRDGAG
jgi:hypothetical protein